MSTPLTSLASWVMPYVPDCSNIVVQFNIRQAAIEFMRRTLIWRKTLSAVSSALQPLTFAAPLVGAMSGTLNAPFTGPTRDDYVMTFDDGSSQVVTLVNGGAGVSFVAPVTAGAAVTYSQVAYAFPATTEAEVCKLLRAKVNGRPVRVVRPDEGDNDVDMKAIAADCVWTTDRANFNVFPAPTVSGIPYELVVALMPTQTATTIPDDVFSGHAEDIAAGALARLLAMPRKSWTDLTQATGRRAMFEARIGTVAAQVAKGFSRGRTRVRAFRY